MPSSPIVLPHFQIKFDGENLSQVPPDLGMLENHLVGGHSLEIKISDCENRII
jgi:hypothetical protein